MSVDSALATLKKELVEVEAQAGRLKTAIAALESGAKTKAKGIVRKGKVSTDGGRAPRGQRRAQVLDYVKANPNSKPSEIAKAIGVNPTQVSTLLRGLKEDKQVKKTAKGYSAAP